MKDADRTEFSKILLGFAELKGKQLSEAGVSMFWSAMQDWAIEDFRSAANVLVKSCQFFPTPKEFEDLRKASEMSAGEAWAIARDVVRRGGSSSGDARTDAAIRVLGGYDALGRTNSDQFQFLERRFCEHYEDIGEREDVREALPNFNRLPYDPTRSLT